MTRPNPLPKTIEKQLTAMHPVMSTGCSALWDALFEAKERIRLEYLSTAPAPDGVSIYITEGSNGKMYARAQSELAIFDGRKTLGLKREGSIAHRRYAKRIEYREAKAAYTRLEILARDFGIAAVEFSDLIPAEYPLGKKAEDSAIVENTVAPGIKPKSAIAPKAKVNRKTKSKAKKEKAPDTTVTPTVFTPLAESVTVESAIREWINCAYPLSGQTGWMQESLKRNLPRHRDYLGRVSVNNKAKRSILSKWPAPEKGTEKLSILVQPPDSDIQSIYYFEPTAGGVWAAELSIKKYFKGARCTVLTDEQAKNYRPAVAPYKKPAATKRQLRTTKKPLPKPSKPKALDKLSQVDFNRKWSSCLKQGISASIRPQDGLWQVEVPGYYPMHGASLEILDLCVQSMIGQEEMQKKYYS